MRLSVIIVHWNTAPDLRECLSALREFPWSGGATEILVVDNASSDGALAMLAAEFPEVRVIANTENVIYAAATNQALRAAVGDAPGTCSVPRLDPTARHNAGATMVTLDPGDADLTDTVPLITVDSLTLPRCELIKIDTEGFEDRVILGARHTLGRLHPTLYIEVHDREKLQRLHSMLKPIGYSLILHNTRFFRASNPMGEVANIFPNAGGSALIALPPGRSLPDPLPGEARSLV